MTGISRGRKAFFVAVLVLVAYALSEIASLGVYAGLRKKWFSFAEYGAERAAIEAAIDRSQTREFGAIPAGIPPGTVYEVLHPYLGFVQDPTRTPVYSELGFPDADVRLYRKDPKRVVIGIFGGSFADGLARTTKDVFVERLRKSPRFAGKEVLVLTVCMGGYKQPQQLLALAWLLSLGAHFDVIVNLDGFNEVVLPAVDNMPKGVSPFYPRNWSVRMGSFDATMLAFARQHADLVDERKGWAHAFSSAPLRWSVVANLAWKYRDRVLDNRIREVNVAALAYRPAERAATYSARGPAFSYADDGALYDDLTRLWKDASLQMQALASANGIAYLHFLQPNQYVAGSKPMGAEERKAAWNETHPYRKSVDLGYPKLVAKGKELRQQGVAFFDLTGILAGHQEPLYVDTCCHLEKPGYDIVAARIADEIVKLP